MTDAPSADYPLTTLRTAVPAVEKAIPDDRRGAIRGAPHRGRQVAWALAAAIVLAVVAYLSWFAFFSPVTVSVVPVQSDVRQQVFGLGTVGARVQSNIGFEVAGVLVALGADQGDRVRVGQVLAQLDVRDIEAQVAVAKAAVAQARASLEKAKADVEAVTANLANAKAIAARRRELVDRGFKSIEEVQTTEALAQVAAGNLASAKAGVLVAEAGLQSAEAQQTFQEATLAMHRLRAPYDAWVISRNLELGSMPNPGQSVFTLVAENTVWVRAYVDERLAGRLSLGQPVEIILRSKPGQPDPGHIARIEIQSDAVNEERLVDVAFDQVPDNIHLAEQAEVVITTGTLAHAVVVPPTAVSDLRGGRGTVWTVEEGRLARQEVRFGPELLDGRLPVLRGLPPDVKVVSAPVSGARVGRAARIAEASAR
jgi:HlyD family secretion protein